MRNLKHRQALREVLALIEVHCEEDFDPAVCPICRARDICRESLFG